MVGLHFSVIIVDNCFDRWERFEYCGPRALIGTGDDEVNQRPIFGTDAYAEGPKLVRLSEHAAFTV